MTVESLITSMGPVAYAPLQAAAGPMIDGIPNRLNYMGSDVLEMTAQAHASSEPFAGTNWETFCDGSSYVMANATAHLEYPFSHRGWGTSESNATELALALPAPLFSYDSWTVVHFLSRAYGAQRNSYGFWDGSEPEQPIPPHYSYWMVGDPWQGDNSGHFQFAHIPRFDGGQSVQGNSDFVFGQYGAQERAFQTGEGPGGDSIEVGAYPSTPHCLYLVAVRFDKATKQISEWHNGWTYTGTLMGNLGTPTPISDVLLGLLGSADSSLKLFGGWDWENCSRDDPENPGETEFARLNHSTYGGRMAHLAVFDSWVPDTDLDAIWEEAFGAIPTIPYTDSPCGCRGWWPAEEVENQGIYVGSAVAPAGAP